MYRSRKADENSFAFRRLTQLMDETEALEDELQRFGKGGFTATEWKGKTERLARNYEIIAKAVEAIPTL